MNYYPEPGSLVRDKLKVVLDMSNYATKKELDHTTDADTFEKRFYCFESWSCKLDINKLINVTTSLNNLKTKVKWFRCC